MARFYSHLGPQANARRVVLLDVDARRSDARVAECPLDGGERYPGLDREVSREVAEPMGVGPADLIVAHPGLPG